MTRDCSFLRDLGLDGRVALDGPALADHAADYGTPADAATRPDAVAWPASTADVSAVLAAANDRGVPVTPYAGGSGLEGGAAPVEGGVSLDLSGMDAVLEVRPDDLQADVEPGVLGDDLDAAVRDRGLFFPPAPSSGDVATVGGMVATDASGMQTVAYGEVGDWVLGLEAVLADGTVVETGSRAVKTSCGYNLTDLLVGSEGTLAVVTRVTLELAPEPPVVRGGRAAFPSLDAAGGAVAETVQRGHDVAKLELVGADAARVADARAGVDLPAAPTVFVEFHGEAPVVEHAVERVRETFASHGAERLELAADEEMERLWRARAEMAYAMNEYDPDREMLHAGDVTVPVSRYPDLVRHVERVAEDRGLIVPCFGHAGDGNLHYSPLVDRDDPDELAAAEAAYREVVERAVEWGGTATGEHGVGLGKREYLRAEHGDAGVAAMRAVKEALDPEGTLNPGKVFP
ncbi:MAG: FAD-binding oxidoreductase [Halobacteriaceae archaeon]